MDYGEGEEITMENIKNCPVVKEALDLGIGYPETEEPFGLCLGYTTIENDDEPCERCKRCNLCSSMSNEGFND